MSPEKVQDRLLDIRTVADDDEAAHSIEDGLYLELLTAIAQGDCEEPPECARLAITSKDIEFARWMA